MKKKKTKYYAADKYESLSTTNKPVDMSVTDIVDMLKEEINTQKTMLDTGLANMILNADEEILDMLISEYDSQLLWNLSNTSLGKGILIGLLIGSISQYFEDLNKVDEEEWGDGDYKQSIEDSDDKEKH